MFGRRKEEKRHTHTGSGLSQFGLLDIPDLNDFGSAGMMDGMNDDDDDNGDLEAELMALTSGKVPTRTKQVHPASKNFNAMVEESMRDIPSDEEQSGDENDPELLAELSALNESGEEGPELETELPAAGPGERGVFIVVMLEERLKMYQEAELNAKTAGETSRARRFGRGVKALNDLLKQARAGQVVKEEDIPPPVVTCAAKKFVQPSPPDSSSSPLPPPEELPTPAHLAPSPPSEELPTPSHTSEELPKPLRPAPPVPPRRPPALSNPPLGVPLPGLVADSVDTSTVTSVELTGEDMMALNMLKERQDLYKKAALQAKRAGNSNLAIQYVRTAKQFDPVIAALQAGKLVDLSAMPPPPPDMKAASVSSGQKEECERQRSAEGVPALSNDETEPSGEPTVTAEVDIYSAPPAPATVMEALEQRLSKYRSVEQAARDEGNTSKARRIGRIVKQYETAIKLHSAGMPFPVDELPTPPGFAPIPVETGGSAPTATNSSEELGPSAGCAVQTSSSRPKEDPAPTAPPISATPQKMNVRKIPQSRQEKQLAFLVARQKEFKEAALQAKRKGEVNQAKEYLRLAKGFDPLIEASNCGLPVDMDTVPIPPDAHVVLESDFDFVTVDDCIPGSDAEIFDKLEEDLLKQAKMCLNTRDHFKAIGDIASANRFEQLALHSKKDLNAVRCAHKRSEAIPRFHYEMRSFSIVQCCTDLGDNDLELTIIQGISYNVANPKDVDTYVKFEFPYPSEDPPKDRTSLIKDTNNPAYNTTFKLTIHRNSRACQRVFKRHSIKLEVWSRGGFLKSDTLIGTAAVKLLPLETKCTIHDSFDLMDGRKPVGGKLEAKVRIRNPILTKQVEQVQEKWLVIDHFQ